MITQIKRWLETAFPEPTEKDQATQIGVHLEEVTEFMESLGVHKACTILVKDVSDNFKKSPNITEDGEGNKVTLPEDYREQMLDALCDQIITATSVAHSMGFDIVGALKEVNASNWSKFEDGKPIYDENGKVIKGKDYFKPNLKPFISINTSIQPKTHKHGYIEFTREMNFNLGSAFHYVWNYADKNSNEELDKALLCIDDYITNGNKSSEAISVQLFVQLSSKLYDCNFDNVSQYAALLLLLTYTATNNISLLHKFKEVVKKLK